MQTEVHDDHIDRDVVEVSLTGQMLLEHPLLNKGSSFPEDERREFHLLGLLPPHVAPLEVQLVVQYARIAGATVVAVNRELVEQ